MSDVELQKLRDENLSLKFDQVRDEIMNSNKLVLAKFNTLMEHNKHLLAEQERIQKRVTVLESKDNSRRIGELEERVTKQEKGTKFVTVLANNKWIQILLGVLLFILVAPQAKSNLSGIFELLIK